MAKDPAFLFYPGDWQGGTMLFTRHTKGCYMDLLIAQFNNGRLSEANIKLLLGQDYNQQWLLLSTKFTKDANGLYYNERLEKEIERRKLFSEKQRGNGMKGGRPKKPKENPNLSPNESLLENRNETEYLIPKEFLRRNTPIDIENLQMKTGLSPDDFEFAFTQWSLKVEEAGWEYSAETSADVKRLKAGFEKWLNTWMQNLRKNTNGKQSASDKRDELSELANQARNNLIGT